MAHKAQTVSGLTVGVITFTILLLLTPNKLPAQSIPTSLGWYQIPNTAYQNVCPPASQWPVIQGVSGCMSVTVQWGGGTFDSQRNRLVFFGGGHNQYHGNEVYALELNTLTMKRLNDPTNDAPTVCSPQPRKLSDGKPTSRHMYNQMAYIPTTDKVVTFGGAGDPCGSMHSDSWLLNMSTLAWTDLGDWSNVVFQPNYGHGLVYDPNRNLVWMHDYTQLYSFDPATSTWSRQGPSTSSCPTNCEELNWEIDPKRSLYIGIGAGMILAYDIRTGSSYARQTWTTTGDTTCVGSWRPGLAYDSVQDRLVCWPGGDTVYLLNLDTKVWTPVTYSGGATKLSTGIYGRFRYSKTSNLFVTCNDWTANCYTLRLTSGSGTSSSGVSDTTPPSVPSNLQAVAASASQINLSWSASTDNIGVSGYKVFRNGTQIGTASTTNYSDTSLTASTTYVYTVSAFDAAGNASGSSSGASATTLALSSGGSDFQSRCSAAGVIICRGFDTASEFTAASYPNSGIYPAGDGKYHGTFDSTVKASGGGSLRFEILGGSGANSAGYWWEKFGQSFGPGQTFYVQFRQRFDPNMINLQDAFGGGGWKQVIFHNQTAGSCALMEITTNNYKYRKFPLMYTECGGRVLEYQPNTSEVILEYSNVYPPGSDGTIYCRYSMLGNPANKCFFYQSDQWMTFYYRVTIGDWGQPNSTIQAWASYEGQALTPFVNRTNFVLSADAPGNGFDILMLTPYDTGKDGRAHPTAYTWYDELIVSTQPISAPSGVSTPNPPPAAPLNLRVQ